MVDKPDITRRAFAAFRADLIVPPRLTLRGANEVDSYDRPEPFDGAVDAPTDEYIERFAFWGIAHLDGQSWRHYLPRLIDYTLRREDDPAMASEAFTRSLRPRDRYPPRLASLDEAQEAVIRQFLEAVAFDHASATVQDEAQQALEEWWLPNPRARPSDAEVIALRQQPVVYRDVVEAGYRLAVPDTLTASGTRNIPSESRRVQTWGGYLCGDAHTILAVNVTPLAARTLEDSVDLYARFFEVSATPIPVDVPGARRAVRLDAVTPSEDRGEQQVLIIIVAESDEQVTLTIRTWEREDLRRAIDRIAASLDLRGISREAVRLSEER